MFAIVIAMWETNDWLEQQLVGAPRGAKTQLAAAMGISTDQLSKILSRIRAVTADELLAAMGYFGEGPNQFTIASAVSTTSIPDLAIFGGMGGGGLVDVQTDASGTVLDPDQVRGYWSFPDYLVRGFGALDQIYAWEVRGDSMEPTIAGGSVVFVDTTQDKLPPDDIYAMDYGDGLMVKRLKLVPRSDRLLVISDNEIYGSDDLLREEVRVYGRIVGWFQWRG